MRPLKSLPLIAAVAGLLLADTAAARIIMLDANFDARAVGSQLQRRGALFGEPVPGPYDYGNEVVIQVRKESLADAVSGALATLDVLDFTVSATPLEEVMAEVFETTRRGPREDEEE